MWNIGKKLPRLPRQCKPSIHNPLANNFNWQEAPILGASGAIPFKNEAAGTEGASEHMWEMILLFGTSMGHFNTFCWYIYISNDWLSTLISRIRAFESLEFANMSVFVQVPGCPKEASLFSQANSCAWSSYTGNAHVWFGHNADQPCKEPTCGSPNPNHHPNHHPVQTTNRTCNIYHPDHPSM